MKDLLLLVAASRVVEDISASASASSSSSSPPSLVSKNSKVQKTKTTTKTTTPKVSKKQKIKTTREPSKAPNTPSSTTVAATVSAGATTTTTTSYPCATFWQKSAVSQPDGSWTTLVPVPASTVLLRNPYTNSLVDHWTFRSLFPTLEGWYAGLCRCMCLSQKQVTVVTHSTQPGQKSTTHHEWREISLQELWGTLSAFFDLTQFAQPHLLTLKQKCNLAYLAGGRGFKRLLDWLLSPLAGVADSVGTIHTFFPLTKEDSEIYDAILWSACQGLLDHNLLWYDVNNDTNDKGGRAGQPSHSLKTSPNLAMMLVPVCHKMSVNFGRMLLYVAMDPNLIAQIEMLLFLVQEPETRARNESFLAAIPEALYHLEKMFSGGDVICCRFVPAPLLPVTSTSTKSKGKGKGKVAPEEDDEEEEQDEDVMAVSRPTHNALTLVGFADTFFITLINSLHESLTDYWTKNGV